MKTLSTNRLNLRRWDQDDADFVFDMYSRWDVKRFIGPTPRIMVERSEAVERISIWQGFDHPVHGFWAVEIKATGELAGTLLLKLIPASGESTALHPSEDTEIGWHFHPDYWGHGYASEAAAAALQHAFAGGLEKVVAVTSPENLASQRVCTRIGMTHAGPTSDYYNASCELFVSTAPGLCPPDAR